VVIDNLDIDWTGRAVGLFKTDPLVVTRGPAVLVDEPVGLPHLTRRPSSPLGNDNSSEPTRSAGKLIDISERKTLIDKSAGLLI